MMAIEITKHTFHSVSSQLSIFLSIIMTVVVHLVGKHYSHGNHSATWRIIMHRRGNIWYLETEISGTKFTALQTSNLIQNTRKSTLRFSHLPSDQHAILRRDEQSVYIMLVYCRF